MASLKDINKRLAGLKTEADEHLNGLRQVKEEIDEMKEEQQESFDNMPETFQNGERGETCQGRIDALEELGSNLESAINEIDGLGWECE